MQQGKPVRDEILESGVVSGVGSGGSEGAWWVVDAGATYHVTGDPSCMFESRPLPVGTSKLMGGDMRSLDLNTEAVHEDAQR